jgi:hypothetical protein
MVHKCAKCGAEWEAYTAGGWAVGPDPSGCRCPPTDPKQFEQDVKSVVSAAVDSAVNRGNAITALCAVNLP